ncbi:hypothetical protein AB0B45_03030 [Nonomuraea sp. NPDC049152]|uniref:hypothetical protein n=1 Tax=Nonomuraea sp. NPDC049152 TaxID=3154350 RepID=UPI0033D57920
MTSTPATPTPEQVRELATRAEELAAAIDTLAGELSQTDPAGRAGFRLPDAAGLVRQAASELLDTAADLTRLGRRPFTFCSMGGGVCPEHGDTLASIGSTTRCTVRGCARTWGYGHEKAPCAELATHRLIDASGVETLVCAGHAVDARNSGLRVEPFTP